MHDRRARGRGMTNTYGLCPEGAHRVYEVEKSPKQLVLNITEDERPGRGSLHCIC